MRILGKTRVYGAVRGRCVNIVKEKRLFHEGKIDSCLSDKGEKRKQKHEGCYRSTDAGA